MSTRRLFGYTVRRLVDRAVDGKEVDRTVSWELGQ
jgi:hypothetical protein